MESRCSALGKRWSSRALLICTLAACDPEVPLTDDSAGHPHAGQGEDADDFQGCPNGFPSVVSGLQATGEHLTVEVIAATPAEPERYINGWTVDLSSADGSPAGGAEILRGETYMPVHGHDGRVKPQMTALSEPGRFRVDRLNFTMRGPWEVRFWLRSASLEEGDYVVFDVCVAK